MLTSRLACKNPSSLQRSVACQNLNLFILFPALSTHICTLALLRVCVCVWVCMPGCPALCWAKPGYTAPPHASFPFMRTREVLYTLIILYIARCNHGPVESRRAAWGQSLIQYHWIINGKLVSMFGHRRRADRGGEGEIRISRFVFFLIEVWWMQHLSVFS